MKGKIVFGNSFVMGNNPAEVDIESGIVTINPAVWQKLTPFQRSIVLLHEQGHYKGKTGSEIKADIYLIEKALDSGEDKDKVLSTFFSLLPNDTNRNIRKIYFAQNILYYDWKKNGNLNSKKVYEELVRIFPYRSREPNVRTLKAKFDPNFIANIGNTANRTIELAIGVWQILDPDRFAQKSQFEHLTLSQKQAIIESMVSAAGFTVMLRKNGNWNKFYNIATLKYTSSNSLQYLAYMMLIKTGVLAGGTSQSAINNAYGSFMQKNAPQYMLRADTFSKKILIRKESILSEYSNATLWQKFFYSENFWFYLIAIISLIIVIIWQLR